MKKVIFILFLVLLNACQTTSNINKVSSNSKTTKNFLNPNNDCKAITLQDIKNLDVNDTDMKNPSGLFLLILNMLSMSKLKIVVNGELYLKLAQIIFGILKKILWLNFKLQLKMLLL